MGGEKTLCSFTWTYFWCRFFFLVYSLDVSSNGTMQAVERGENLTILTNKAEDLRDSVVFLYSLFVQTFFYAVMILVDTEV